MSRIKVYCAGPLFNSAEKREMKEISETLLAAGFDTFLPHEDGLEFSKLNCALEDLGVPVETAHKKLSEAIFALDVHKVLRWSDAVVANFNGRVPDEGTVVEASLAWHAGKTVVLYKDDTRSLLEGADNPMCTGLGGFRFVTRMRDLPEAIHSERTERGAEDLAEVLTAGGRIAAQLEKGSRSARDAAGTAQLILELFGGR